MPRLVRKHLYHQLDTSPKEIGLHLALYFRFRRISGEHFPTARDFDSNDKSEHMLESRHLRFEDHSLRLFGLNLKGWEMIQVCCYKNCGVIYGEKEPLSDRALTYGLCPKHLGIYLDEIKAKMDELKDLGGSFKILVVEDNALFRDLFTLRLQGRFPSIEIHGAVDGEQALRQVEALRPNLIFMDIRLPGENGLELTRKIKTSHPEILVIIFTSHDLTEYRETADRYKADYFLPKGSPSEDIFSLIESILPTHKYE